MAARTMPLESTPPALETLAALHRQSLREAWSAKVFAQTLANPQARYLGWHEAATLVGFCIFMNVAQESQLLTLVVAASHQRQGYGQRLLEGWQAAARQAGFPQLYLEVNEGNLAARALYAKAGFRVFHRRPRYYPDGGAAVCLQKRLDERVNFIGG